MTGGDGAFDRTGPTAVWSDGGTDVVLELPAAQRDAFKDPFGPVYTDVEALRSAHVGPIVTVGDIVTYHFERAGHRPHVAAVDGRTKRETAPDEVRQTIDDRTNRIEVENPPGTLTEALLRAIATALADDSHTTIVVDGEEDLAAVPAVLAAATGTTVVYGQPDEGMVAIDVTDENRATFCDLLSAFDGDVARSASLLGA